MENRKEKRCIACKKIIDEDERGFICPGCVNHYLHMAGGVVVTIAVTILGGKRLAKKNK